MNYLIILVFTVVACWLIKRDTRQRTGISRALWIPTIWVAIIASRPVSLWVGLSMPGDTLEGSPIDRVFYFGMLVAASIVLASRRVAWAPLIARNWPILLFYFFLLVSVVWANAPLTSLKRWIKEFGNILIVLVILTEVDPLQALRTVFVRCAYVLVPLSIIFIRYFPDLGRRYGVHGGDMEATGVTCQKNSLGAMVVVCGLIFLWDWIERKKANSPPGRLDRYISLVLALIGAWLLYLSDSKTSIIGLAFGAIVIASTQMPLLRNKVASLGTYGFAVAIGFFALDSFFGLKEWILSSLGRDMTFTGRTDVWRELLNLRTDPMLGTGFMSLWDDMHYQALLPDFVAFSAHNGYLEIYLAGGYAGIVALALMILATGIRINKALKTGTTYAVVRFAVFCVALTANFSESNFACMTPIGFLFLVAAIGSVDVTSPVLAKGHRRFTYAPRQDAGDLQTTAFPAANRG